jgi:hypothetical protein
VADLTPDDAIARARAAVGIAAGVMARAWRVERLDRPGEAYYLVVFGGDAAATAVSQINAHTGESMKSARLGGSAAHLAVDANTALRVAGLSGATSKLVWCPCQISMSSLHPFWQVSSPAGTVFVDQQAKRWDRILPGHG